MTRPVEVRRLSKRFGTTRALIDMNLIGTPGQVHAVVGENGAGKSTLMKILSGVYKPDSGTLSIAGKPVEFSHPRDAQNAGISTIFQEFSLLPNLSVSENLLLGREHKNGRSLTGRDAERRAHDALTTLNLQIDPRRRVGSLGVGAQQMVEIAKGILTDASIFIFDEPTAALAAREVTTLFELIRRLASEQKVIFYISHRLSEIFTICDDVTVMKDGRLVERLDVGDASIDAVISAMVGRTLEKFFEPRNASPGEPLLVVDDLASEALPGPCSFSIRSGEIVGLAGLEGQGQSELMQLLAGFDHAISGRMSIAGQSVQAKAFQAAVAPGLGLFPGK
ncbi:MAG: sugar ABC transporter ATP-binding protein, partial [Rhodobacteraceae bacterium]|nr:sugar ABC transporter ATP-binding protein [Paracoccaceae bacterium]